MSPLRVALCGSPNVGKSTVFNALTGLRQHTGNWAGKTVDSAVGQVKTAQGLWRLMDLPGAYSLLDGSPEEIVASDCLAFQELDAVIVVADATCLSRHLGLALQAAQAHPRTLLCLNLMDEAEKRGIRVDTAELEKQLGLPVVAVSARNRKGLGELKRRVWAMTTQPEPPRALRPEYPEKLEQALFELSLLWRGHSPAPRFAALRCLTAGDGLAELLSRLSPGRAQAAEGIVAGLETAGYSREKRMASLIAAGFHTSDSLCRAAVHSGDGSCERRQLQIDRLLARKCVGIPLMLCLLGLVLALSLYGANWPSQWLTRFFDWLAPKLHGLLEATGAPGWVISLLMDGVYRVTVWVTAVMLPPMAIFFPLFTLMEDWGLLPRIAFHLDKCFQCCRACGKQALCMCMGLGCNAVGVTGCRIIQSPRERLIAILTNALMPCNGRFPTLMLLITLFFVTGEGLWASVQGAALLVGLIVGCVLVTLGCSRLLSATVLRGLPSSFALELPPFRRPNIGQVAVRSLLDRTLFVLGRAVSVAAPAGLCVWVLAHVPVEGQSLLLRLAALLEPVGRLMGLDGAILLAFVLGFPANEIVLPILLMIYLNQNTLVAVEGVAALRQLLEANGWSLWTAASMTLFSLFHWPCSTTVLTVKKETGRWRWALLSVLLPTLVGFGLCAGLTLLRGLLGG